MSNDENDERLIHLNNNTKLDGIIGLLEKCHFELITIRKIIEGENL